MKEQVFDPLRKKHVALTPEERVRQWFIRWLHEARSYPLSLMASEYTIKYNALNFRCDIICFTRTLEPLLIVECKAPEVKIDRAVIDQITRYNLALRVKYLVITNGESLVACEWKEEEGRYRFITDIPYYKN